MVIFHRYVSLPEGKHQKKGFDQQEMKKCTTDIH